MHQYLLIGRTGVGKSSFINEVLGGHIAPTSPYEACTKVVKYYTYNSPSGIIRLIDTPGLAEDNRALDLEYLDLVKTDVNLEDVDAFIYITRLNEPRFRPEEKQTLELLTTQLGASIWQNSWLILTFAASVTGNHREEITKKRVQHIESFLRNIISKNHLSPTFIGFQRKVRVDSKISGWSNSAVSITSLLIK